MGQEDRTSVINYGDSHLFLVADSAGGIGGGAAAADDLVALAARYEVKWSTKTGHLVRVL